MSLRLGYNEVNVPTDVGSACQYYVKGAEHGLANTVPASSHIVSNVIQTSGWQKGGVGVISSQAGSISVQRYLDQAGTIPVGAAITQALAANTAASCTWSDGLPFGSIIVTINNTAGSAAALTDLAVLLQSA